MGDRRPCLEWTPDILKRERMAVEASMRHMLLDYPGREARSRG